MKTFCESLGGRAVEIINFEQKNMIPMTKEPRELHEKSKICYVCKRKFVQKYTKNRNYCKSRNHCYYTGKYGVAAHSIRNLEIYRT